MNTNTSNANANLKSNATSNLPSAISIINNKRNSTRKNTNASNNANATLKNITLSKANETALINNNQMKTSLGANTNVKPNNTINTLPPPADEDAEEEKDEDAEEKDAEEKEEDAEEEKAEDAEEKEEDAEEEKEEDTEEAETNPTTQLINKTNLATNATTSETATTAPITNSELSTMPSNNANMNKNINNKIIPNLNKLVMNLLNHQVILKLFHFQTNAYGAHKASDEYLEKYAILMDRFLEVAQGIYGRVTVKKYTLSGSSHTDTNIGTHLNGFVILLTNRIDDILNNHTDLLNIRDEIISNIEQLKYLLTFK